ncbi:FHIPEP family type III secretion protein, partial [Burkholderia pseudomallei]
MEGASKFGRGEAMACLFLMSMKVIGGLFVVMGKIVMRFASAGKNYTLLPNAYGLVAQTPSLVISTAAGVIASRVATDEDNG